MGPLARAKSSSGGAAPRGGDAPAQGPAPAPSGEAAPASTLSLAVGQATASGTAVDATLLAAVQAGISSADKPGIAPIDRAFLHHFGRALKTRGPQLPPMPEAVVRIDRVLRDPTCTVRQVADVVRADPAVATKLVGIANSPFYAGLGRIRSVEGAITRMGLRETKCIVQALALGARLMRVRGHEAEVERLYHHTIATALAASAIATRARLDADTAFLAGLIHDVGRSVFLTAVGDFKRAHSWRESPSPALMQALSDALHVHLSVLVAHAWRAGADIEEAVRHHEAPEGAPPGEGRRLCQALALADDCARHALDPARGPIEGAVRVELATALGVVDLAGVAKELEGGLVAFGIPMPGREAAAAEDAEPVKDRRTI